MLPFGHGVGIGEGFEEGAGGRKQLGRAFDVEGTLFVIVPECRDQVACGFAHSARDHWLFTLSCDDSASLLPSGRSKAGDEGLDKKLLSDWGQVIEERVMASSGFGAEAEPASPCPVLRFIAFFGPAVKDDAAV